MLKCTQLTNVHICLLSESAGVKFKQLEATNTNLYPIDDLSDHEAHRSL